MKKTFAALILAAVAATPAMAAGSHRAVQGYAADPVEGAYAAAPGAVYGSGTVIENGQYAGQDPDPNVRLQLRQQQDQIDGGH